MVASATHRQGDHKELNNDVTNATIRLPGVSDINQGKPGRIPKDGKFSLPPTSAPLVPQGKVPANLSVTVGDSLNYTDGDSQNTAFGGSSATNLTPAKPIVVTSQTLGITNTTLAPVKVPAATVGSLQTRESTKSPANISVPFVVPTNPELGGGVQVAVVVMPILIVLIVLVVLLATLVVVVRRRKLRSPNYKRRTSRDEESSMDVMSTLMSRDPGDNETQSTAEPVYAIVDKTKKCQTTQSVSDTEEAVIMNDLSLAANGYCALPEGGDGADSNSSVMPTDGSDSSVTNPADQDNPMTKTEAPTGKELPKDEMAAAVVEEPLYDIPPQEEDGTLPEVKLTDSVIVDPTARTLVEPRGLVELDAVGEGLVDKGHQLLLVECAVYEAADHYDPNCDDEDGTYEIPDSPATVRARHSMARLSALQNHSKDSLKDDSSNTADESIAIPKRVGCDTSDSDSDLESDFEDMWNQVITVDGEGKVEGNNGTMLSPPVPKLLPPEDPDSDYMAPKCHKHCPPGPDWKPFHEYDPVYVPHSDPAGMAVRLDNQNYVRGRQRNDSRHTNPYEEIQFGSIYDTVDDDDDIDSDSDGNLSDNGLLRNPIKLPPRVPLPPSPPPPLVPRRTRPISMFADIGHRASTINKPLPPWPESDYEPRYSGLIMDDVSDHEDGLDHDYTALAYTKLRSVGSGPLLDGHDDIKAMDETDSETYAKSPFKPPIPPPRLTPRTTSNTSNTSNTGNGGSGDVTNKIPNESIDNNKKTAMLFFNGTSEVFSNGHMVEGDVADSSDSDDSYEPFDFDILPPQAATKITEK